MITKNCTVCKEDKTYDNTTNQKEKRMVTGTDVKAVITLHERSVETVIVLQKKTRQN